MQTGAAAVPLLFENSYSDIGSLVTHRGQDTL